MPETSSSTPTLLQTTNIPESSPSDETWSVWKEKLDIHFCQINCQQENNKKAILLKSIGTVPYKILHSLCSPASPVSKSFDELCSILETQYIPPIIIFQQRKIFHSATRKSDESVADWFARLKLLCLDCKFGEHLDAFMLDKFVLGLPDKIFQKICEEDEKFKLHDAFKKALILETKFSMNHVSSDTNVNFVKRQRGKWKDNDSHSNSSNYSNSNNNNKSGKNKKACSHCGWKNHVSDTCKFKNSKCHACGKIGHLASICRSKGSKEGSTINFLKLSDKFENYGNRKNKNCQDFNQFDFSVYSMIYRFALMVWM